MDTDSLYSNIYKGKIKESIYKVTKLVIEDTNGKNIEFIENTFISICSYIGTYISIVDIRLWIDVMEETYEFIKSENVVIKNIYVLLTKLCIVCDIYIKNPISKSGVLTLQKLREKIIDIFNTSDKNISYEIINKFDNVLPPNNSETYDLAKLIISGVTNITNECNNISCDNYDELIITSNKLRDTFDYLSRKTYKFETKFYHSDNDSIWFLWGIIKILCKEDIGILSFELFMHNYSKKFKLERMGLLWGMTIVLIYLSKKNVARVWNDEEIILIKKVNEVSMDMFKHIKNELNGNKEQQQEIQEDQKYIQTNNNGLNILINYVPIINDMQSIEFNEKNDFENDDDTTKKIKYNKK
tara:strand:- start:1672 stop:2739 length:1068 start_codon:yes stop_codon:yes gene_type:complete